MTLLNNEWYEEPRVSKQSVVFRIERTMILNCGDESRIYSNLDERNFVASSLDTLRAPTGFRMMRRAIEESF